MDRRIAIIDLGTNTFHLLLAEQRGSRYDIILRDRLAVKIGMGGINDGLITNDGINRALAAMRSFRDVIGRNQVGEIHAFGTSALRNARNAAEIISRIKADTNIDVRIISGDLEAYYIYRGAKAAVSMDEKSNLIMDIGGGSVEFIIADRDNIQWKRSFEIGAQRLLEKYQKHDPILDDEIETLNDFFSQSLKPLFEALMKYNPRVLVGSSGTFDTLSDIFCLRHHIPQNAEETETPLSLDGFYEIHRDLLSKDREQRMAMPGMIEMRVDMIVVASCMIHYLLEKHPFQRIRVSTYSLKEGVLADLSDHLTPD